MCKTIAEPKARPAVGCTELSGACKWDACPNCGSENFLVGTTKTLCNMCDWETTEYPYSPNADAHGQRSRTVQPLVGNSKSKGE